MSIPLDLYSLRILRRNPLRLMLTAGGMALCIVLMLFLLSAYRGVADGALEYIRKNKADLWVLQRNATNILRASSVLFADQQTILRAIPAVQSASPVLLVLSTVKKGTQTATVYLTGFEPRSALGGPPQLFQGRSVSNDDEIVLDKSFATKFAFKVGDSVQIQDAALRVVGISSGTNAFVIQYAFVTLKRAQSLVAIPGIVTCYLVKLKEGNDLARATQEIRHALPRVETYNHEEFLQNNVREMQAGFLPFIYIVASIGVVVLTAILSLLLSVNILERRKDFAVFKTIGAPGIFLTRMIVEQALLIASAGIALGLTAFFPLVGVIEKISPEISTKSSSEQVVSVGLVVFTVSLLSALISMRRLRHIYPMEAFS